MSTPLTDNINALITYANSVTGASDTTLSQVFATLANGYSGGGSGTITYQNVDGKPLTAMINALISYSNQVTGASDTTASEAIATLVAGWSGGSSLLYNWDFTQSLTDTIQGLTAIDNSSSSTPVARDSSGLHFTTYSQEISLPYTYGANRAYEMDISYFNYGGISSRHLRVLGFGVNSGNDSPTATNSNTGFIQRSYSGNRPWSFWWGSWDSATFANYTDDNWLNGKTVRVELDAQYYPSLYVDGVYIGKSTVQMYRASDTTVRSVRIGNAGNSSAGGNFYTADVTGFRIYDIS